MFLHVFYSIEIELRKVSSARSISVYHRMVDVSSTYVTRE